MKILSRVRSWFKAMTHRSRLDGELQFELEFHIRLPVISCAAASRKTRRGVGPGWS